MEAWGVYQINRLNDVVPKAVKKTYSRGVDYNDNLSDSIAWEVDKLQLQASTGKILQRGMQFCRHSPQVTRQKRWDYPV